MGPDVALYHCMQSLLAIIRAANVHGIGLAEKAIHEFLHDAHGDAQAQDNRLGALIEKVRAIQVSDNTPEMDVALDIEDLITSKRKALRNGL